MNPMIFIIFFVQVGLLVETKRFVPREKENDIMVFLKKSISTVNELLDNKGWEYIVIPSMSYHYWTASLWTGKGTVGKFSTMALNGNDQFFIKTRVEGANIFNFDIKLRLDHLQLHYLYEYSHMFFSRISGILDVKSKNNTLRVIGVLNIKDDGKCALVVETAEISNRGQYEVSYSPKNISETIEGVLREFTTEKIVPGFVPAVNKELQGLLKFLDLSVICKILAPL